MTKRERNALKKKLMERLAELSALADCNLQGLKESEDVRPDVFDQASQNAVRDYSYQLCSRNNQSLLEIERALQDIEAGVYGICESCGEEIAVQRLRVRPAARHCIDCKTAMENMQRQMGAPGN